MLYGPKGESRVQALLDCGSNATLFQQEKAEELGFSSSKSELILGGTNVSEVIQSFGINDVVVSSVGRRRTKHKIAEVLTIPNMNNYDIT